MKKMNGQMNRKSRMQFNFEIAMNIVLKHEGLYSNNLDDPGAETVFGISRKYWPNWNGWATIDNLKLPGGILSLSLLKEPEVYNDILGAVYQFYKENFWDKLDPELPSGIDIFLFDMAVNQGIDKAVKALQFAVGQKQDGVLGPKTKAAMVIRYPETVLKDIFARRIFYYMNTNEESERIFGQGWANRAVETFLLALEEV